MNNRDLQGMQNTGAQAAIGAQHVAIPDAINRRMRFLVQDEAGANLVDPVEVAIPTVLPLKIAKLYLPEIALKAVKGKLPDALKAMGFK